ncbi:neurotrimin isoform X2 [Pseudomyrmex gracilis]|uniref:neurotrimin isoform X2 n=1 Tax=Pseudomyrmex gracilis TaxID=219809 RepID=UPI000995CBF0|nr:neurotrimin isoform X2 [Pseudomyrmex gracilis]
MTIITTILVTWIAWIFVTLHSSEGRQGRSLLPMTNRHSDLEDDESLLNSHANRNRPDMPRFAEEIGNVTVHQGRDALLSCVVDNLKNFKVAWVRVDTQTILTIHRNVITQNPRISLQSNDHRTWYLHIKEAQEVDRGWYMCQVNTDPMESRQGYLQVVVPPSIITKETSTDMVVRESSNVTLTCKATGFPEPYVMWRREDGKNINYNGESVNVVDGENMHIVKISRLHMGAYLCIASNGVPPSVSKRVSLRVQFPPMLSIPNQLEGAYIGQDVTLECHTEAYPNSINYWTTERGDMIVSGNSVSGDKYEAIATDSGYTKYMMLKIRNVGPNDFGSYKCVAQNSLGGTDGVIKLDQIPAPSTTSTTQPPYYATSSSSKNGRNGNKKSRPQLTNDYEVEEWRNSGYGPSMRPPGELPDTSSPGTSHRAQLVLHLTLSLLSLLLPAIRR